jgi:hypothetical protein
LKPRHSRRELADDRSRQGYSHKQAHTETMVSALFAPWPAWFARETLKKSLPGGRHSLRGQSPVDYAAFVARHPEGTVVLPS